MSDKVDQYRVLWADLGSCEYKRSLSLMNALRERTALPGNPGHILFIEHPPTITLGYSLRGDEGRSAIKSGDALLRAEGIEVVEVDRGGKATYHGPGQLVCYLVLSLKELRLGVKRYVGKLMDVVVHSMEELGVAAKFDPSYPGVWVGEAKLAAVGIRVTDRVTSHGFAVNVDPDLSKFGHIVPCGIADRPVTSLAALGIAPPEREGLTGVLLEHLSSEFHLDPIKADPDDLWSVCEGRPLNAYI